MTRKTKLKEKEYNDEKNEDEDLTTKKIDELKNYKSSEPIKIRFEQKFVDDGEVNDSNSIKKKRKSSKNDFWRLVEKVNRKIRLFDFLTVFGILLWLIYIKKRPDELIKRLLITEFTIEQIWLLLLIILGCIYILLFFNKLFLLKSKRNEHKLNRQIASTAKNSLFITILLIISITTVLYFKYSWHKEKIFYNDNPLRKDINVLVTKLRPIVTKSYFDPNFTEIDFSTTIFQKLLTIRGYDDKLFFIDFYNHNLDFKNGDFKTIKDQTNYDAILAGEVLEENSNYYINNCLYLSKQFSDILQSLSDSLNNSNKLKSNDIITYYTNPINYYQKLADKYLVDDSLLYFATTNYNLDFSNDLIFPSNLTFSSSIEKSPSIILSFLEILYNWGKNDSAKTDKLLDDNIKLLDKIIYRFPLIETKDKPKSEIENSFMIEVYSLKAFFLNKKLEKDQKNSVPINYQLYFEKINAIFLAAKSYYEFKGFDEDEIKIFEFLFFYVNNKSIISCSKIDHRNKYYKGYKSRFNSIYISKLTKIVDSITTNESIQNILLDKLLEL